MSLLPQDPDWYGAFMFYVNHVKHVLQRLLLKFFFFRHTIGGLYFYTEPPYLKKNKYK